MRFGVSNLLRCAYTSPSTGEVVLEVDFTISGDTEHQTTFIPLSKLNSVRFEKIDSRCICFDENGKPTHKIISNCIQLQWAIEAGTLPKGTYLDKLGWINGGTFVAGPLVLGVKLEGPRRFSPEILELIPVSSLPRDPGPVVERVISGVLENTDIYLPLLAFAVMSPLRNVFVENGLPACASLNLHGRYGQGKTHAARTSFAPYNRSGGEPAFFLEANSTDKAVFNVLANAPGQTVVLDDIAKGSSGSIGSKRSKLAAEVIGFAQNNASREKMGRKDSLREKCEACAVLTGELSPDAVSEVTRCVRIDVKNQLMGGPAREDVAAVIFSYIDWFGRHFEQETVQLKEDYASYEEGLKSNPKNEQVRVQKSPWEMSWAMSSFLRFAKSVRAVSDVAESQIDQKLSDILVKNFQETCLRLRKPREPIDILARIICESMKHNAFPHKAAQGCLCVKRDDLVEYLKTKPGFQNVSGKDITDMLKSKNLLRMDRSGKSTRKINGTRYLTIPIDVLPK